MIQKYLGTPKLTKFLQKKERRLKELFSLFPFQEKKLPSYKKQTDFSSMSGPCHHDVWILDFETFEIKKGAIAPR